LYEVSCVGPKLLAQIANSLGRRSSAECAEHREQLLRPSTLTFAVRREYLGEVTNAAHPGRINGGIDDRSFWP
jgi:hypothetical protein